MAILEVKNIEKHFGSTKVLKDISFDLEEGQTLAIIGSSGSGKTTLLRCLNFLETPNHGTISVKGEKLFDASLPRVKKDKALRDKRLHFGMVFQSFNLFPQYTALENVMLAEKLLAEEKEDYKKNKKEILEEIENHGKELLKKMGLEDRMDHYPHQLSGGQQQRVLLARALCATDNLLILDEPVTGLDPSASIDLYDEIKKLNNEGVTIIMVTHDIKNALSYASHILHLEQGKDFFGTVKEYKKSKISDSFLGGGQND